MKKEFVITNDELTEKGLNLYDYALNGDYIPAIINIALDICVTRCCYLNDNFKGETSVEEDLTKDSWKVSAFKKLQFRVLWNLIFSATDDPVDLYVDTIIVHELGWGKINGIQKGLYYKHD